MVGEEREMDERDVVELELARLGNLLENTELKMTPRLGTCVTIKVEVAKYGGGVDLVEQGRKNIEFCFYMLNLRSRQRRLAGSL